MTPVGISIAGFGRPCPRPRPGVPLSASQSGAQLCKSRRDWRIRDAHCDRLAYSCAADRLKTSVESASRATLSNYEMQQVTARLETGPLKRTLILSGPPDDFQQRELLRIMNEVPGVQAVRWDRPLERRKVT